MVFFIGISLCCVFLSLFQSFFFLFFLSFVLFFAFASSCRHFSCYFIQQHAHTCTFTEFTFSFFNVNVVVARQLTLWMFYIYIFGCNLFSCSVSFSLRVCMRRRRRFHCTTKSNGNTIVVVVAAAYKHMGTINTLLFSVILLFFHSWPFLVHNLKLCWYFGFCVLEWVNKRTSESFLFVALFHFDSTGRNNNNNRKTYKIYIHMMDSNTHTACIIYTYILCLG